jgi:hypothetical protein
VGHWGDEDALLILGYIVVVVDVLMQPVFDIAPRFRVSRLDGANHGDPCEHTVGLDVT